MTGPQMVKKWTHIRDRYKRILNEVMVKQARGEHFQPSWKFFDVLHGMLCKNYSSTNIPVTPVSGKTSSTSGNGSISPGCASPITTINFANAAQLYSAALQQAAMNQSLNSSVGLEPGSDKDEIIAADFMVTETRFDDEHDHDDEHDKELMNVDKDHMDDGASSTSGNDAQSHHSLTSHKENANPTPSKRSAESAEHGPPKKRK